MGVVVCELSESFGAVPSIRKTYLVKKRDRIDDGLNSRDIRVSLGGMEIEREFSQGGGKKLRK